MKTAEINCILFDKIIDYLNYKHADFSTYQYYDNGFRHVKDEYIIETRDLSNSKKLEIRLDDTIDLDTQSKVGSIYPYSRVFFWRYTDAKGSNRCYLKQNAIYDKLFFVCKRKSELSYAPIAFFETEDGAKRFIKECLEDN